MWLGSWACRRCRPRDQAGQDPAQIGFMPWPPGRWALLLGPSAPTTCRAGQARTRHTRTRRAPGWDWFTDKSTYAQDQGDVPTLKSAALPPPSSRTDGGCSSSS